MVPGKIISSVGRVHLQLQIQSNLKIGPIRPPPKSPENGEREKREWGAAGDGARGRKQDEESRRGDRQESGERGGGGEWEGEIGSEPVRR